MERRPRELDSSVAFRPRCCRTARSERGTPVAEVNTLMAVLQETAAKRQAAEAILRDGELHLQLALAAAQLGPWRTMVRRDAQPTLNSVDQNTLWSTLLTICE
jgi:hypothetical protein